MAIRAVILDVSGTLINEVTRKVVPGVPGMLARLRAQNITIFAASNEVGSTTLAGREFGIDNDHLLNPINTGGKKGTKKYIGAVRARFGIRENELLYLGDTMNDCREAVNSDIAFFQATWSSAAVLPYGIRIASPSEFADIVETYFLKQALWYYKVDDRDTLNRPVIVRALIDIRKAEERGIKNLLKGINQSKAEQQQRTRLVQHLSMHLFASLYLEGLHLPPLHSRVMWALYPGHDGPQTGVLDEFASMASRLFRDSYQDIILRHTVAQKLAFLRKNKEDAPIDIQLQSICLNPAWRNKIVGATILLFDDFTTYAHGFETARNFLFNAGADHVISIAVGKYPPPYFALSPEPTTKWDSFTAVKLTQDDFISKQVNEIIAPAALEVFDGLI